MSASWVTIIGLIAATALIKASGPVLLGGRELPERPTRVIALMAPALLTALVVTQTFTNTAGDIELDARALGVGAAGALLLVRRKAMLTAVVLAAVVAATVRAL